MTLQDNAAMQYFLHQQQRDDDYEGNLFLIFGTQDAVDPFRIHQLCHTPIRFGAHRNCYSAREAEIWLRHVCRTFCAYSRHRKAALCTPKQEEREILHRSRRSGSRATTRATTLLDISILFVKWNNTLWDKQSNGKRGCDIVRISKSDDQRLRTPLVL